MIEFMKGVTAEFDFLVFILVAGAIVAYIIRSIAAADQADRNNRQALAMQQAIRDLKVIEHQGHRE